MNPAIETCGLTRRFRKQEAVHDLTFTVPIGGACAFLGRNGAGKTTTIKMLAGLLPPTRGESFLLGRSSQKLTPDDWRQIGYVSENQELYGWLTAKELIAFTRALYPGWDPAFEQQLTRLLDVPLDRKVKALSRGQRAKLALLLAIAFHPRLLILDEPFAGLDPLSREEFLTSLLEITAQQEWSMFFSTHDIDDVERLADQVAIIEDGVLQVNEPLERLQQRFREIEVEGGAGTTTPPPGAHLVKQAGPRLSYVDLDFSDEAAVRARFPGALVQVLPMSLKAIFLAQAKIFQQRRGAP
jgi:ABC-2 type transport system ATP-binding protein